MEETRTIKPGNCTIMHNGREINIKKSEDILRILGKKYSLLIIGVLGNFPSVNFNELKRAAGCPRSNLLSARLKEMNAAGIIQRTVIDLYPVSVKYELTKKGKELREKLIPFFMWIDCNCYFI
ncbi:MAG: winged helix-turn-helix transcriptional regulator [Thermoplasmataceae archaeon]